MQPKTIICKEEAKHEFFAETQSSFLGLSGNVFCGHEFTFQHVHGKEQILCQQIFQQDNARPHSAHATAHLQSLKNC